MPKPPTPMSGAPRAPQQQAPRGDFLASLPNMLTAAPLTFPTESPGQGLAGAVGAPRPPFNGAPAALPSYAAGGTIGPGGQPIRPPGAPGMAPPQAQQPLAPDMIEMQIQDLATRQPQVMAQIRQAIDQAVASGELTPQELNMAVQLATTVMRNPALYPQIRQFAIQQGLATEQDLPQQYDQGLVVALLIAARAAQAGVGGQNMLAGGSPAMAGAQPTQSLKAGGPIKGSGDSKPVVVEAHTGEYVIPKHVVDMKGREFFDKMIAQYSEQKPNA